MIEKVLIQMREKTQISKVRNEKGGIKTNYNEFQKSHILLKNLYSM